MKLLLLLVLSSWIIAATPIKVITFNIRYDNPNDGENSWNNRYELVVKTLNFYEPDIFGLQEALFSQVQRIDSIMVNYSYYGVGRDDGITKGEFSPIFYNKDKYLLLESETTWLSDTPEKPSVGWDASLERIVTYCLFEDIRLKTKIAVFNTHYDHQGTEARENSSKLINEKIKKILNTPVILMGDFNSIPNSKTIEILKEYINDSKEIAETDYGSYFTYNAWILNNNPPFFPIDYIFVNDKIKVKKYAVLSTIFNNRYSSDHFPVFIEAKIIE